MGGTWIHETLVAGTFLATSLPDALVIALFSGIGFSSSIFGLIADDNVVLFQGLSGALSFLGLLLYFLLDIGKASRKVGIPFAFAIFLCLLALSISVSLDYPWASPFLCLQASFVILGFMRSSLFSSVSTKDFFTATAMSLSICGTITLAIWIGWRMHINLDLFNWEFDIYAASENDALISHLAKDLEFDFNYSSHCLTNNTNSTDVREAIGACEVLNHVVQMQQWCPAVVGVIDVMSALCCTFMLQAHSGVKRRVSTAEGMLSEQEAQGAARLQAVLKRSLLVVMAIAAIAYAAASTAGSAGIFSQAFYAFGVGGIVTIFGHVYVETDQALLHKLLTQTRFGKIVMQVLRNEWMRAFVVCSFSFGIPTMLLLDRLRQNVRRLRFPNETDIAKFTPAGRRVINELRTWHWSMILRKADIFSVITILLFVGLKGTYVFFSWLNYFLLAAQLDLVAISSLVFAVGLLMFMLPIVPGTAVYLFSGVVLGFYSTSNGLHFGVGIAVGAVLASVLKHVACTGQYFIGYLAGKSVHVQRFVGVDKVPTRAMEMILNKRGFALGKVCILVAGPDFPTSVLCGILKLNIPQMLLGTTPVIVVSIIPQVAVGALVTLPGNEEYSALATVFAFVIQVLATLYVSYRILKTAEENLQSLSQYREEHAQVAELTRRERSYTRKFLEVSSWAKLPIHIKGLLVTTSGILWSAAFVLVIDFMSAQKLCFRRFSMTDRIDDDFASGGLGGNWWNIVLQPLGSIVLVSTLVAWLGHGFVGMWLDRVTRRNLLLQVGSDTLDSPVPSPCDDMAEAAEQPPRPAAIVIKEPDPDDS